MSIYKCRQTGDIQGFQGLIAENANINGLTPLHRASLFGNLEIIKELIKYQANINEKDACGWTPLHHATYNGHLEIVEELIKHQVLTDSSGLKLSLANINEQTNFGSTPIHFASAYGHLEIVKKLIDYSNLSMKNLSGYTALDLAKNEEIRQFITNYQELPAIKEPE